MLSNLANHCMVHYCYMDSTILRYIVLRLQAAEELPNITKSVPICIDLSSSYFLVYHQVNDESKWEWFKQD